MDIDSLYRRHYQELYSFAYQMTFSKPESEDLVQESFCRLLNESKIGTSIQQPRAWLYKVLLNLTRTRFSVEKQHNEKLKLVDKNEISSDDIHHAYIEKEKRRIITNELNLLPDKDRNILILYHQGLAYSEIAEALEMNTSSVGTTLARAIEKLADNLKKKHHELFE